MAIGNPQGIPLNLCNYTPLNVLTIYPEVIEFQTGSYPENLDIVFSSCEENFF